MTETTILLNKNIITWDWNLDQSINNSKLLGAIVKSFESLGYKLSSDDLNNLLREKEIENFYKETFKKLSAFKGANVDHVVFYNQFPKVPDIEEQYLDALLHYIFGLLPGDENHSVRVPLYEDVNLIELHIASSEKTKEIVKDYFNSLLAGKTSWSDSQVQSVKELYSKYKFEIRTIPQNKENLVKLVVSCGVEPNMVLTTPTDVLRYITALSDGDVTLSENCKFKKFTRKERREILKILNSLRKDAISRNKEKLFLGEGIKYSERWVRVGEILHPGEYAGRFPYAFDMFKDIRESVGKSLNSEIEDAIKSGLMAYAASLLTKKPGEFARRLDKLVRDSKVSELQIVLDYFESIAESVSIPVLLQLRDHFLIRLQSRKDRVFVLKGKTVKTKKIENNLSVLPEGVVNKVIKIIMTAITNIISKRDFLDENSKVFIEPKMFNIAIPDNSMRGASNGKKMLTKGSKIKLDDNVKTLRFFTHWKNSSSRVDIDISALFFSKDLELLQELSWRDRYISKEIATFSGDITNSPKGASEFIDINIKKAGERFKGARYIVISNNVYTGQPYNEIPECFSGVMLRERPNSGEIFEPSTVISSADLGCPVCGQMIAFIYDIENNCLIWADSSLQHFSQVAGDDVVSISDAVLRILDKNVSLSIGDIYKLYSETHGVLVNNIEDANIVIGKDISEYDIEKFSALL